MTCTIGILILTFARRLQAIIKALIFEWGNSPPQIGYIKTIRLFLLVLACTYLTVNVSFDIVVPMINILYAIKEEKTGDFDIKTQTGYMQIIDDLYEIFILFFNLEVLFFYHKMSFNEQTPIINLS